MTSVSASPTQRLASPSGNIRRYIKSILNRLDSNPYHNLQIQSLTSRNEDDKEEDIVSYLNKLEDHAAKAMGSKRSHQ